MSSLINKYPNFFVIFVLIFCFIMVIFSINQIIKMTLSPITSKKIEWIYASETNKAVEKLLQSQTPINYQYAMQILHGSTNKEHADKFPLILPTQLTTLSPPDQNIAIRLKLVEWQLQQLQDAVLQSKSIQNTPLIFKIGFWFWSLVIWICSVVISRMLNAITEIYILPRISLKK